MPYSDSAKRMLMEALRSTIRGLEQSEELSPDDPTLREIKSSILRRIARRQREAHEDSAAGMVAEMEPGEPEEESAA